MELCDRFSKIKLLLSDVDGVMNDGRIYYLPTAEGISVAKFFNVRDGLGIRLFQLAGFEFGVITGRRDEVVKKRCEDLGCKYYALGVRDKRKKVLEIIEEARLRREEVAYIGDDWNDIPVFGEVGLSLTVADAPEEIRRAADYVVPLKGGEGVIRYTIERILKCRGLFEEAVERFLSHLREE